MEFLNKNVYIHGVGGYIRIVEFPKTNNMNGPDNQQLEICTVPFERYRPMCGNYRRSFFAHSVFRVVPLENDNRHQSNDSPNERKVAFHVLKNNELTNPAKFLNLPLYGDDYMNRIAAILAECASDLLPELIPTILEYIVVGETDQTNFEGPGFNYTPMTAEVGERRGEPGPSQIFTLQAQPGHNRFGIKSICGKYWRSQHWTGTVSQSDHCLGDETWSISLHPSPTEMASSSSSDSSGSFSDDSSSDEDSDHDESMSNSESSYS